MTRDEQIIDLYLNHTELTVADIAAKFNVSTGTVSRIARINNLPRRTGNNPRFSKTEEQQIIAEYQQTGISLLQLEKKYHTGYNTLKNLLGKYNIPVKSLSKISNPDLDEYYFATIDTPEKAYWIGWLITDGSIKYQPEQSDYEVSISLQPSDEDILHLFEADLGAKDKVYTSAGYYKRFALGNKQIVTDLVKLGITPNKSFTVTVPTIDPTLHPALIRGLFDGDGGFSTYTRSSGQHCQELSFCGNLSVITWVANALFEALSTLTHNSVTTEASIYRIRWSSKKDICLIRDYIYQNHNGHYLKRKFNAIYANTETTI